MSCQLTTIEPDQQVSSIHIYYYSFIIMIFLGLSAVVTDKLDDRSILMIALYFILILTISSILFIAGDGSLSSIFLLALIIRLLLVLLMEAFPPASPIGSGDQIGPVPKGLLFADELFYVPFAHWVSQSWKNMSMVDWGNQYDRVATYYGIINWIAGKGTLWGRLANTLIGSLAAVVIYDAILKAVGDRIKKIAGYFCVLSPVMVLWSAIFLKECLLTFGVALLVNSIVRYYNRSKLLLPLLFTISGTLIILYVRPKMLLLFVPILFFSLTVLHNDLNKSMLFKIVTLSIGSFLLYFIIDPLGLMKLIDIQSNVMYASALKQEIDPAKIIIPFPFFQQVMGLPGPLRVVGMSFLLMISPVITILWTQLTSSIPGSGLNPLSVFGGSAYAISWWLCLPFLVRAVSQAVFTRDTWWWLWGGMFLIWLTFTAYANFGGGYESFRWRDALVPVIMLLSAKGLDLTVQQWHRGGLWPLTLRMYGLAVAALVLLRGVGILGLS